MKNLRRLTTPTPDRLRRGYAARNFQSFVLSWLWRLATSAAGEPIRWAAMKD